MKNKDIKLGVSLYSFSTEFIHEKLDLANDPDERRSRAVLGTSRYRELISQKT